MQKITKRQNGTLQVGTEGFEPTLTQQHFRDECDVNNIVKRFAQTGDFARLTSKQGAYGDFSKIKDYQSMCDTVIYAQQAFMALPSATRAQFKNDPGLLLDFIQNPANYDEALKLGLVNPKANTNDNSNDKSKTPPDDSSKIPSPSTKIRKTTTTVEEPL